MTESTDSVVIDGFALQRKADDKTGWTYVPRHPTLGVDSHGKPMLSILEAGAVAFVQCTAQVALRESDRAALLQKLQEVEPEARTLDAAPLTVDRIALEWLAEGGWSALGDSKGSGMPPWTAALAATLTAEALAALKAAISGESGRVRLSASLTLAGSHGTIRRVHQAGSVSVKTTAGETASSYAVETDTSAPGRAPAFLEMSADLADLLREAAPRP